MFPYRFVIDLFSFLFFFFQEAIIVKKSFVRELTRSS